MEGASSHSQQHAADLLRQIFVQSKFKAFSSEAGPGGTKRLSNFGDLSFITTTPVKEDETCVVGEAVT